MSNQDSPAYAELVRLVQQANANLRMLPLEQPTTPQQVFDAMYPLLDPLARWLIDTPNYPGRPAPRPIQLPTPHAFPDDGHTYWNGVRCPARRVIARVGHSPRSTWWCAELEGQERAAVEVTYGDHSFLLDDEDGSGWRKVTIGRGSPEWGHGGLPDDSVVLRDREVAAPEHRAEKEPNPVVELPQICREHQRKMVTRLNLGPDDPWLANLVTLQILLFRATMYDDGITKRVGGDATAISLVLAELGCLACARHDGFLRAITVMRKGGAYAAQVARGEVYDPDFGIPANVPPATPGEKVPDA